MEIKISSLDQKDMRIEKRTVIPLQVLKKVYQGYGLADWEGRKVFIQGGVPGDLAEVELTHRKRFVYFGKIKKVLIAGEGRCEVECEAFGECGGCDWLNIDRNSQLEYKEAIIDDFFHNLESEEVKEIGYTDQQYHYRNKCFYPLREIKGKPVFGMYSRFSHSLVEHQRCYIQPEIFDRIAADICQYILSAKVRIYNEITGKGNLRYIGFRSNNDQTEIQVILVTLTRRLPFTKQLVRMLEGKYPEVKAIIQNINPKSGNVILGEDEKLLNGNEHLEMQVAGKAFEVSYKAFFQVNIGVLEQIIEFCLAETGNGGNLLDLYCGCGVIGICLAEGFDQVIGIDNSLAAIKNARHNAQENAISNSEFICGDATEELARLLERKQISTVVIDPPRKGLTTELIDSLLNSGITRIIYISCNPATQVRDLRHFAKAGYRIKVRKAFDMFPQTWHIENVVILEKM